ncbi:MAG: low molecular weight protein-tyrosine-phosphatase [Salibacteraceae bacterium]
MKKVLFVCLGNICRSPMAHGIFRKKAKELGLKIMVESAGTSAYHIGEHADSRAISTLKSKGIDIMDLKSRLFVESDFIEYDYIFTMDTSNQAKVLKLRSSNSKATYPEMIMNLVYPGENISVPDPYYGGATGFEDVYRMLDLATDKLINHVS